MVHGLTGLLEIRWGGSFDPSDTSYMDRDSDDEGPVLRTCEVTKKAPKVTRTCNAVDIIVRISPEFLLICSRKKLTCLNSLELQILPQRELAFSGTIAVEGSQFLQRVWGLSRTFWWGGTTARALAKGTSLRMVSKL
jgi:hypothetical protein